MSVLSTEVRAGAYADSIVLMQLQSDLQRLDGILAAGVVMGTAVNLDLLRASDLLDAAAQQAQAEDLIIAIRADTEGQAAAALSQIDTLMKRRKTNDTGDFQPRTLGSALRFVPEASWVSISIPGRYAHRVADEALDLGCHVFLYSDNVTLEDELDLKSKAKAQRRLLLGPDCGSAIIGGVGFGFSNVVRPGPIGLVCASGTGLQAIASEIHQLGSGLSHAIGTGGRDLSSTIRGATARQGLDLLGRDTATQVIVLASKTPDRSVSPEILGQALEIDKPVVVLFSGLAAPGHTLGNLYFARSLTEAAALAVDVARGDLQPSSLRPDKRANGRHLRGLFAGGTLALEAVQVARPFLTPLHSNLGAPGVSDLPDSTVSRGHTILDLGADEYTVGRLHPMMDQRLRLERLEQEAADPETGLILLDVILGRGSQADPAAELAPILDQIQSRQGPPVVALVVGTDEDPQDLQSTAERLRAVGADVFTDVSRGLAHAVRSCVPPPSPLDPSVDLVALQPPAAAINVGLASLREDLVTQDLETVQVDWRPPAGGNDALLAILERMKT